MSAEKPSSKGQAWFCTTGLPSDIVIEVDDMTFHLHKFPLMSKSRKLHQLITEQEEAAFQTETSHSKLHKPSASTTSNASTNQEHEEENEEQVEHHHDNEIEEEQQCHITLPDFPGDSETFETAAKFCYGVKIELSSSNVAPLRCAAEVLEMTEEYSEDNLISKTDMFLSQSVVKSVKESIRTLKSCERLMPLAETLGITQRCIDSIAIRSSSTDPSLFGWPVSDGAADSTSLSNQILWNGIEIGLRNKRRSVGRGAPATGTDSWFEDLALLSLPLFKRLIFAMRAKDVSPEIIENSLICYAKRYIPGISRSNRKPSSSSSSSSIPTESEQRELLETIIANLPLEKTAKSPMATRFLFGLLRTANILNASEASRSALEKKIGSVLEEATLDDLLIPSYSYLNETLYDVYCVERILGCFLDGLEESRCSRGEVIEVGDGDGRSPALVRVGKLIDGYLSEIASDANVKPDKFYELAVALPEQARLFDDGLYRAVDVYLKAHPWISEAEREKISGMMDCQKLTLEACTHAAQNERLPLRAVVQVLFFEQLQLRHAIAGTLIASDFPPPESSRPSLLQREQEDEEEEEDDDDDDGATGVSAPHVQDNSTWRAAVRENQVLRLDMDSMRSRVHQLERECSTMKKVIEKIDKSDPPGPPGVSSGWRGSLMRKFSCKFKTQVCDSHESTVVEESRKNRHHHHHHQ